MTRRCSVEGCERKHSGHGYCKAHLKRFKRHGGPQAHKPLKSQAPVGAPMAFIEKAIASQTDECLIWPYGTHHRGHGFVNTGSGHTHAHRLVLIRVEGEPPTPEHEAAHRPLVCHNPPCVNPRHLYWATRKQNAEDRLVDGTDLRGEKQPTHILTAEQALEIYHNDDMTYRELGDRFGISFSAISGIKRGETWKWLTHADGSKLRRPRGVTKPNGAVAPERNPQ